MPQSLGWDRCRGDAAQAKLEKPKPPFPQCVTEPGNIEACQAGGRSPETQAGGTRAGEVDAMASWHLTQAAGHGSHHSPPFHKSEKPHTKWNKTCPGAHTRASHILRDVPLEDVPSCLLG